MIPEKVIEVAHEGGYQNRVGELITWQEIALDPLFFQALGKALGWPDRTFYTIECVAKEYHVWEETSEITWIYQAHRFYDLILTGGDTEVYWNDLLK